MSACSFFSMPKNNLQDKISEIFGKEKSLHYARALYQEVFKDEFYSQNYSFPRLKKEVKNWIQNEFHFENSVRIKNSYVSLQDSSVKFIMELTKDSTLVETVLIPERKRLTLCVSTQVGCAQACRFCQTGRMGLTRSLTCDEIIGQLIAVERWKKETNYIGNKITNIVYMGMGEPLDNVDNVIKSAHIFCDPQAFFLSHNKITVSTVGLLPQLNEILNKTLISVALSLHSPFEDERTKVMPVNAKHNLTQIISCLKEHLDSGLRKSFLVQYTLIRGVNNSPDHAAALIKLLSGYNFKINLIPLNEHEGTSYRRPDLGSVYEFSQILKQGGLVSTIRLSKGRDIGAACGQLIKDKNNEF